MTQPRMRVAVLGATGAVGQRFVERLNRHPWFTLVRVAASARSQGRPYASACRWRMPTPLPEEAGVLTVTDLTPEAGIDVVFSALAADVARDVEPAWAQCGAAVFSNARTYRMDPDVPLLIPEVNGSHLEVVTAQRENRGWPGHGMLATNPNCSATVLAMALAPLHRAFGVEAVHVVTLQAVSGAGYPGVSASDIVDNVIPNIEGEEAKLESETQKMLGAMAHGTFAPAPFSVSAQTHRVPVIDGHTMAVSVRLRTGASPAAAREAWGADRGDVDVTHLPSAPPRAVVLVDQPDRPQPRLDRDRDRGMVTVVGNVRPCPVLGLKFTALGHNTVRGAAGGSLLNAELACATDRLGTAP